jgi:hypothetical protein
MGDGEPEELERFGLQRLDEQSPIPPLPHRSTTDGAGVYTKDDHRAAGSDVVTGQYQAELGMPSMNAAASQFSASARRYRDVSLYLNQARASPDRPHPHRPDAGCRHAPRGDAR